RSRLKRRSSVTRPASGCGVKPSFSNRARMNRSIGVLTQLPFLTCGKAGRAGAMNAQCFIADCRFWVADSLTADRGLPDCESSFNPQSAIRNPQSTAAEDGAHCRNPAINAAKTITTAKAGFLFFIVQPLTVRVEGLRCRGALRVIYSRL